MAAKPNAIVEQNGRRRAARRRHWNQLSEVLRETMKNMPQDVREKRFRNVGDPRRTDRFKSTYEYGVKSPFVAHGIAAYERAFKMLEATLAEDNGPWILGSDPTLADINLMPYAARLDYL